MDFRPLAWIGFLLVVVARWAYLSNRDGRWISVSGGQKMKRWTGTHWVFRPMTAHEAWDDMDSVIW